MKNYFNYWGKSKDTETYHLLPYHMLDTAAVIDAYLQKHKYFMNTWKNDYISKKTIKELILFFSALHDIGKFSESFQNLKPELLQKLQNKTSKTQYIKRHDALGQYLFEYIILPEIQKLLNIEEFPWMRMQGFYNIFAHISSGHHGIPQINEDLKCFFSTINIKDTTQYMHDIWNLYISSKTKENLQYLVTINKNDYRNSFLPIIKNISWQLSGLTTLADWIASGDKVTWKQDELDVSEYYEQAFLTADKSIMEIGFAPVSTPDKSGMERLFPDYASTPTPLQKYCNTVEIPKGPQLWILEDIAGAGKTEAALVLASRIREKNGGNGIFVGLPTMATSNQMYERMASVYYKLFKDGETPSLVLSHGSRHLNKTFAASYKDGISDAFINDSNDDQALSAYCHQWLADSSKKSLLANCGVGTVDQLLMGALPVRYQNLRIIGMAQKVLIIDEVHAYDSYMMAILSNLLSYHASIGGSAILLSATLPAIMRHNLMQAWNKDTHISSDKDHYKTAFPLVSSVTNASESISEIAVQPRDTSVRSIPISFFDDLDEIYSFIKEKQESGKCVCWIRNTVKDVYAAQEILTNLGCSATVFHSRYTLFDRLRIEKEVIATYGKTSTETDRTGKVLIATQVVEQSLDIDFDYLITDLAPIDLIIQRAGRLQRHNRPGRDAPVLHIHIPKEEEAQISKDWFKKSFKGASYVYKDPGILWRTKEILKKEGVLKLPENARLLMESVYNPQTTISTPEVFEDAVITSDGENAFKNSMGKQRALIFESGYSCDSNTLWTEEEDISTRLSESTIPVYICMYKEGSISPLHATVPHPWEQSCLKLMTTSMPELHYNDEITDILEILLQNTNLPSHARYIIFTNNTQQLSVTNDQGTYYITYNENKGLVIEKK